jgi:tRNA pseudouridine55 synthase
MIFNIYKQRGETPLECIQRFAKANPDLKGEKMTYLGRLDPLAEGVLLAGSGEDTKQARREEFFGLDKEYDFISIFGFSTDTYDILGKIVRVEKLKEIKDIDLMKVASIYEGERDQKYPEYSSKVRAWEAAGSDSLSSQDASHISLQEHPLPLKKIIIHKLQFHKLDILSNKELFGRLLMDISKVKGDFRQHEILILWQEILSKYGKDKIFLGKFSAHVSSGTYIRGIVNDMGKTLGFGATTLSIRRTRVGDYKIEDSIK